MRTFWKVTELGEGSAEDSSGAEYTLVTLPIDMVMGEKASKSAKGKDGNMDVLFHAIYHAKKRLIKQNATGEILEPFGDWIENLADIEELDVDEFRALRNQETGVEMGEKEAANLVDPSMASASENQLPSNVVF